jgi:hypothetical protein
MDILTNLPSSRHGNHHVFVLVDRFSKLVILVPCMKGITTDGNAKFFFEQV